MDEDNRRVVSVRSEVKRDVDPDVARVRVSLEGGCPTREACVREHNARLEAIRSALRAAGFDANELQSGRFEVSARREDLYDKVDDRYYRRSWRTYGFGYHSSLSLNLGAPFDLMEGAWGAITSADATASVSVSYDISDEETVRESLMEDAVRRGRKKAETLARAAGMRLGAPLVISYGVDGTGSSARFVMDGIPAPTGASMGEDFPDFNPESIEVECSVEMQWEMLGEE